VLDRKLLVVTGKGGVGKTTIAAALAVLAARGGKRVLLCEIDAKGDIAGAFESGPLDFAPTEVFPGVAAMVMDTEASLKEYLALQLRLPLAARIGPLARTLDFVAGAAPGVKEILTIGKVCWEVRERHYDLVVVDGSASGHVVAQLAAPDTIARLVRVGLIRGQAAWMREILADPARTGAIIVTSSEEMPVVETIELAARLREETAVDLAAIVVNRVLPELFGRSEEERFDALRTAEPHAALVAEIGPGVNHVLDAADLAVALRRERAVHISLLRRSLSEDTPLWYVPEQFARQPGRRTVTKVADALAEEIS
jgi:anion-transporting  ArsA/GET3 family ATPase